MGDKRSIYYKVYGCPSENNQLVFYSNITPSPPPRHGLIYFRRCDIKKFGENFILGKRLLRMKKRYKRFEENFIHVKKNISQKIQYKN